MFAGVNEGTRDIIFVSKVYQNSQSNSVGYNITLSLCPQKGQHEDYIGGNAKLENFQFGDINIDHDTNCRTANVDNAYIRFTSNQYPDQRYFSKSCWQ